MGPTDIARHHGEPQPLTHQEGHPGRRIDLGLQESNPPQAEASPADPHKEVPGLIADQIAPTAWGTDAGQRGGERCALVVIMPSRMYASAPPQEAKQHEMCQCYKCPNFRDMTLFDPDQECYPRYSWFA